ncbi:MAG: 3-hydroxyacyl-ACP dehydratase FabZ [Candidatus Wallbacteria bacterium]|nr:3-hydroxyacyl-ACP dehydratase FabZ [Candidatus Wallbacteria bacterium]
MNGAAICDRCVDLASGVLSREEVAPPPSAADADVLAAIPHRPPFLFIDRILECTADRIRTERTIRSDEPHFRGHYPGQPLMPGVLLCEAVVQSGAILVSRRLSDPALASAAASGSVVPVLTRLQDARFKRMVLPGDRVEMEAQIVQQLENVYFMKGRASVEGQKALLLEFAVTLAPRASG